MDSTAITRMCDKIEPGPFAGVHKYLETLEKAKEEEEREQEKTLPVHKVRT